MKAITVTELDVVTSTSDHLLEAAKQGAPEGTAFRANMQTMGRGRRGRDWISPKGNLYVSILLRPVQPLVLWPSVSLVAGLALYEAVGQFRPRKDLGLKWPNDLLYRGQKCAGLLAEIQDEAIMLGCGVNLDHAPETAQGWPSIALNHDADAAPIDADRLMATVSEIMQKRYNQWNDGGFAPQREAYLAANAHIGQSVTIARLNDQLDGRFADIDDCGNLCLIDQSGQEHIIAQGDVVRAGVKNATSD